MSLKLKSILVFLCFFQSHLALAELPPHMSSGGSSIGNGGDTIVCFDTGVFEMKDMIDEEGVVSWMGRQRISSVEALEFYRAKLRGEKFIDVMMSFAGKDYDFILGRFRGRMKRLWKFLDEKSSGDHENLDYEKVVARLGSIEDGFKAIYGLVTVKQDAAVTMNVPTSCTLVRAVNRYKSELEYDPGIIKYMKESYNGQQLAVLQMHEELYYYAQTQDPENHQNSRNVQGFLIHLLTEGVENTTVELDYLAAKEYDIIK